MYLHMPKTPRLKCCAVNKTSIRMRACACVCVCVCVCVCLCVYVRVPCILRATLTCAPSLTPPTPSLPAP
jgi:hypothetical protein